MRIFYAADLVEKWRVQFRTLTSLHRWFSFYWFVDKFYHGKELFGWISSSTLVDILACLHSRSWVYWSFCQNFLFFVFGFSTPHFRLGSWVQELLPLLIHIYLLTNWNFFDDWFFDPSSMLFYGSLLDWVSWFWVQFGHWIACIWQQILTMSNIIRFPRSPFGFFHFLFTNRKHTLWLSLLLHTLITNPFQFILMTEVSVLHSDKILSFVTLHFFSLSQ